MVMDIWKGSGWGRPVVVGDGCGVSGWLHNGKKEGNGPVVFAITKVEEGKVKYWLCDKCVDEGRGPASLVEALKAWVEDVQSGRIGETRRSVSSLSLSSLTAPPPPSNGSVITVASDERFEGAVKEGTTLVTVGTPSCGPCKMIYPHLAELSKRGADEHGIDKFVIIDGATTEVGIEGQFESGEDVKVFPDFRLWKDGIVRDKWEGVDGAKVWIKTLKGKLNKD